MGLAMISLAYMTKDYCTYFPKSNVHLKSNENHMTAIQMWAEIGASDLEDVEIDWENVSG